MPGRLPGQCLRLDKRQAWVVVKLRSAVIPEAFSVDHAEPGHEFQAGSAPRNMQLEGYIASTSPTMMQRWAPKL